ncbi:hypothetical protein H311_04953 [Anncaliia algerae PRA109]|nr:hypothetical protein H311_04953 [Anncaliia algerae PRA109]
MNHNPLDANIIWEDIDRFNGFLVRLKEIQWVFGAIERDSKKCMLLPALDRSANTLISPINQ